MNKVIQLVITFWNLAKSWAKNYTDAAISSIPRALTYKGAVDYYSDLPAGGMLIGDTYTVKYEGDSGTKLSGAEYAWSLLDGTYQWVFVGPDLSGKADKVENATSGHFAALDASGNLTDAGCAVTAKANLVDGKVPKTELPLTVAVDQNTLNITY